MFRKVSVTLGAGAIPFLISAYFFETGQTGLGWLFLAAAVLLGAIGAWKG